MRLGYRTNLAREAWLFALVGAVGFAVDGGFLVLSHKQLGLDWPAARLLSFTVAATVTWLLNRSLTFGGRSGPIRLSEWRRYLAVNGIGAVLNLGIFLALIELVPAFRKHPVGALAVAAAIALAFNFFGSRSFAFKIGMADPGSPRHD